MKIEQWNVLKSVYKWMRGLRENDGGDKSNQGML
jgi:hypothetical protein